jgi:Icc protein
MRGVNTAATFRQVIDHACAAGDPPEAILATGDLVQDETRGGYERFRDALIDIGVPVYCIAGNHDAPTVMADVLGEAPFQVGGRIDRDGWTLLLLSSFSPGDDGGLISAADLAQLSLDLDATRDRHVALAVHHHPVPMGSRWLDGVALRNGEQLMSIVARFNHVRAVVWGHVHQASDRLKGDLRLLSTPATCAQFMPNSDAFALDSRPAGYRWIDLYADGTIETEVVWVENS